MYERHVMHEGVTYDEWSRIVKAIHLRAEELEKLHPRAKLVIFVDELNTAGAIGAVAETVRSGSLDGVALPKNVIFVGAINPAPLAGAVPRASTFGDFSTSKIVQSARTGPVLPRALDGEPSCELHADLRSEDPRDDYMPPFVVKPLPATLSSLVVNHPSLDDRSAHMFLREVVLGRQIRGLAEMLAAEKRAFGVDLEDLGDTITIALKYSQVGYGLA